MSDLTDGAELLVRVVFELQAKEHPLTFVMAPATALHLAGLMQLALRHPSVDDTSRYAARTFIEHVRGYFGDSPAVLEVLRQGDDPTYDKPATRRGPPAEMIAELRGQVAAGFGHDCEEWWNDGVCQLCDRRQS